MKKLVSFVSLVALVGVLTGCAGFYGSPVIPPGGFFYSKISAPQSLAINKTNLGTKTGEASTECVLGLVSWGDASVQAAAKDGQITQINHTDYQFFNVLGVYSKYTTTAYGK